MSVTFLLLHFHCYFFPMSHSCRFKLADNSLIAATLGRVKNKVLLIVKRLQGYIFKLSLRQSPLPLQPAVFKKVIYRALNIYHILSCHMQIPQRSANVKVPQQLLSKFLAVQVFLLQPLHADVPNLSGFSPASQPWCRMEQVFSRKHHAITLLFLPGWCHHNN